MARDCGGWMGAPVAILLGLGLSGPVWARGPEATAGDDSYRFRPGASEEQGVALSGTEAGVRWSWARPAAAGWDTALLGVRLSAGDEAEPWVEVSTGSAHARQYLDQG